MDGTQGFPALPKTSAFQKAALRFPSLFSESELKPGIGPLPAGRAANMDLEGVTDLASAERVAGFKGVRHGFLQLSWGAGQVIRKCDCLLLQ